MDKILFKLLLLDGNETHYLKNDKNYRDFQALLIEVAKVEKNIRFCNNKKCPCHPEYMIKKLLQNEELRNFLNEWSKGVVESLEKWCETYVPVVADEIYNG